MFDSYFEKNFSAFNIFHFPNFEISVSLHLTGARNTVIIVLTAMVNALYICSLAMSANCNMQVRLPMNNNKDNNKNYPRKACKQRSKEVCNDTYLNTSQVRVTVVLLIMFLFSL